MEMRTEQGNDGRVDTPKENRVLVFKAPTMREAMKKIRVELGAEALILSQEAVLGGVEIHAALELPEVVQASDSLKPEANEILQTIDPEPEAATPAQLQADLTARAPLNRPNAQQVDRSTLQNTPLPVIPTRERGALRFGLDSMSDLVGAYRLVGGSGVGKTSLLIKLVVEVAMCRGVDAIEVVSTDNQRLAGTEQLELACQMLGVRLTSASAESLDRTIAAFPRDALVLIDTTASELHQQGIAPLIGVRDVFVCSAEHSMPSMAAQRRSCGHPKFTAVTHLDRPGDRAALADWLHETGQELLFFGASGYVPEGLTVASQAGFDGFFMAVEPDSRFEVSVEI